MSVKISVVVAVYNMANSLQRCIDSIVSQKYSNYELIIIDGDSTDNTVDIIQDNSADIKYWESKPDRGISHAWNKALAQASGEWIIFLGGDDRLADSTVLLDIVRVLECNQQSDVVYGRIVLEGGPLDGCFLGGAADIDALKRRMSIPHTAAFHRLAFLNQVGRFDEKFTIAMDYELFLRKHKLQVMFVDRLVTVMGGDGVSSQMVIASLKENKRAQLKHKVDGRVKIESIHAYYYLRYKISNFFQRGF